MPQSRRDQLRREAKRLHGRGMSYAEVGRRMGVSDALAWYYVNSARKFGNCRGCGEKSKLRLGLCGFCEERLGKRSTALPEPPANTPAANRLLVAMMRTTERDLRTGT